MATKNWEPIRDEKQKRRNESIPAAWRLPDAAIPTHGSVLDIPRTCGILTPEELHITSDYDAVGLLAEIARGKFTAEAVTVAFCKRAAIAQQLTNCLTEIFFDEAIRDAKELDRRLKENPRRPLPPLYGLPISIKDTFNIAGKDTTIGIAYFANKPAKEDSPLVRLLKDLGAIFYCKTNVPQTLQTCDSHNNLFGRTLNPSNLASTASGSTGGEAALIAMRGSILGVGTDMAGSIRMPSASCGIYGVRPTANLIPFGGQISPVPHGYISGMDPSAGPMATSIRDCQFFLRTVLEADPNLYDFSALRIPWLDKSFVKAERKLRIGFVEDDGYVTPSPPIRRSLRESASKLSEAGHTLVPISLPDVDKIVRIAFKLSGLEGGKYITGLLKEFGEPIIPSVANMGIVNETPPLNPTLDDLYAATAMKHDAEHAVTQLWQKHQLDILLMPPAPHTAVPHDTWSKLNYTIIWNVLDFPACSIPVGKAEAKDAKDNGAKYGPVDQAVYDLYSGPEEYRNLPTAIQLVGKRYQDEELLAISTLVDSIVNG